MVLHVIKFQKKKNSSINKCAFVVKRIAQYLRKVAPGSIFYFKIHYIPSIYLSGSFKITRGQAPSNWVKNTRGVQRGVVRI